MQEQAEPVAQRPRQHPRPRGGADEREALEREVHRPPADAAFRRVIDAEILQRGIQELLDDLGEPVHLVDEQHVAGVHLREHHHQVALACDRRPAREPDRRLHLVPDDVGEGGLAEPRRPVEQHVVQRLAALEGGLERDAELLADGLLPNALVEPLRAQRGQIPLFLRTRLSEDAFDGHGAEFNRQAAKQKTNRSPG